MKFDGCDTISFPFFIPHFKWNLIWMGILVLTEMRHLLPNAVKRDNDNGTTHINRIVWRWRWRSTEKNSVHTIWQWKTFHTRCRAFAFAYWRFICCSWIKFAFVIIRTSTVQKCELNCYSWIVCACTRLTGRNRNWFNWTTKKHCTPCSLWQLSVAHWFCQLWIVWASSSPNSNPYFFSSPLTVLFGLSIFTLIKMVNAHFPKVFPECRNNGIKILIWSIIGLWCNSPRQYQ